MSLYIPLKGPNHWVLGPLGLRGRNVGIRLAGLGLLRWWVPGGAQGCMWGFRVQGLG